MKKGIVMEVHRRYTIVMNRNGEFQKAVPINDAVIGAEVSYQPIEGAKQGRLHFLSAVRNMTPLRLTAMVCVLLLILSPFLFMVDKNEAYAYVNIDVNPSLEIEVDDELTVHSIVPLNNDADDFVGHLTDYRGKHLERVVEQIIQESEEQGLLKNGKRLLAGVSYMLDSHDISITDTIDKLFINQNTDWEAITFQVPKEVREEASDNQQSMNEMMAANMAESNDRDEDAESDDTSDTYAVDSEEEEIINSYYNSDEDQPVSTDKEDKMKNDQNDATSNQRKQSDDSDNAKQRHTSDDDRGKHPSELKGKNGDINSNSNSGNKGAHGNNSAVTEKKPDHAANNASDKGNHSNGNHNTERESKNGAGNINKGKGHNENGPGNRHKGKGHNSNSHSKSNNGNPGKNPNKN